MDNTLKLLIEELKTTTYNSRPNIKYQDQMDLIERLENELKDYVRDIPKSIHTPISIENIIEPVTDFTETHIAYPIENPVLIPKQKGRKPKES